MNDDVKIATVDLGGTSIKSALISKDGKILKKIEMPTEAKTDSKEIVISNILTSLDKIFEDDIIGIGVGSPGCVNTHTGEVNWIENIPCLNGVSITDEIKTKFNLPIFIDNDATNATRGQYMFGAGIGAKNLLGVTLGTGVGGGLILNDRVHHGVIDYAGEIGHMTYIPDGMPCTCGKRGCVEAYASAPAIKRSAKSILKRGIKTALLDIPLEKLEAKSVYDLAKEGDEVCKDLVQEAGKALGVVIGSAINLLNLDRVVIGGGVAAAGNILFNEINIYASRHALPLAFEHCTIVHGDLGNDAGILGTAAMVLMEMEEPISKTHTDVGF